MEPPKKTSIVYERARWADVDLVGIMRYSAFTRFIELAEQELMRDAGTSFSEIFDAPTIWLPRRQLTIEYLAPVRLDEKLELETFLSHMGDSSMVYHVDMRNEAGVLVAAASLVVVSVAVSNFKKVPLDRSFRELLSPYIGSVEAVRARRSSGK